MVVNKERGNVEVANQKLLEVTKNYEKTRQQLQELSMTTTSGNNNNTSLLDQQKTNKKDEDREDRIRDKEDMKYRNKIASLMEENKNLTRTVRINLFTNRMN